MTKKKILTIVLAAISAVCLAVGIFFAYNAASAFAQGEYKGDKLTLTQKEANDPMMIGVYQDAYGVPLSEIKEYKTDGGIEADAALSNIFDRNLSTAWRARQYVTENNTVSLTVFFKEAYVLEGFLFRAENSGRGYFSKLRVLYHDASQMDGDPFKDYGSIESNPTGNSVYVKFEEPTAMTAVQIVWCAAPKYNGNQIVSASELMFMQPQDEKVEELIGLYSDYAYLKLKDGVTDETVAALRGKFDNTEDYASWDSFLDPMLNRATQILAKVVSSDPLREMSTDPEADNVLTRRGNIDSYARSIKMWTFGTNRQATGVLVKPYDRLVIYVEAEESDPLPTLVTTQHWGGTFNLGVWLSSTYTLHRGRNVITAPNLFRESYLDNLGEIVAPGGPVYLLNPYLPKETEGEDGQTGTRQSDKVKVYIEGGETFPIFRKGDEIEPYLEQLRTYSERVTEDKQANIETARYSVVDVTEVVSDRVIVTVQATKGFEVYCNQGYSPQEACVKWDKWIKDVLMCDGIVFMEEGEDENSESFKNRLADVGAKYDPRNEWLNVNFRLMQPIGLAYASLEHIGIQVGWDNAALIGGPFGWGFAHEVGHMLDIQERLVSECSNNMVSKLNQTVVEKNGTRGNFALNTATLAPDDHITNYWNSDRGNFTFWWLIEEYYPGYWAKLENLYRYGNLYEYVEKERNGATINSTEKQIYLSSLVTGVDLSYYFERWGYNLSVYDKVFKWETASPLFKLMMEKAKAEGLIRNDGFAPKLWYLDEDEWWIRYNGKDHGALYTSEDVAPDILTVTKSGNSYSLMIGEDKSGKYQDQNHLGYEVQSKGEDGEWKVVGFTTGRLFSDQTQYPDNFVPEYRLAAYDRALQCSSYGEVKKFSSEAIVDACKIERTQEHYNSLSDAVKAAEDGDTIVLLKDTYETGIVINKKLTIKTDNRSVVITKSGSEPIFTIEEQTFTVETEEGSGQFTEEKHFGDLTLSGSEANKIILDGFGVESEGSLIYVKSGKLNIGHAILRNSIYKWVNDSRGGAIRFDGGTLLVENTLFENNSARLGGAVNIIHRANSVITFNQCTFTNNSAQEGGGFYNTSTATFNDCTFSKNTATSVGGGFANISGGVLYINDCSFTENAADSRGGGFYSDGKVELTGGSFTENSAKAEGAAFCYWRSTSAGRYFSSKQSVKSSQLPKITDNTCENGSAVVLHGEVEYFRADIQNNNCKYAVRLGGATVRLNGGVIEGNIFREGTGKVILVEIPTFSESDIIVYTDAEDAQIVLFSEANGAPLSQSLADRFKGENHLRSVYDETRKEIRIEFVSYTVTYIIRISDNDVRTELKHYRPGHELTFDAFKGDQNQQWYVVKWQDENGNYYDVGKKYIVNGNVTFTAVIGNKIKIEFLILSDEYGLESKTFYAMPGDKYSLPKYNIEGYIHNGWLDEETGKLYQPAAVVKTTLTSRTYTAVIVKKLTVRYWVEADGYETYNYATNTYGYGSKITGENCLDERYVPYGGFIEGFYIKYANGTRSDEFIDFETYTITSDLDLIASVVDSASFIMFTLYDDSSADIVASTDFYLPYGAEYKPEMLPIPVGYHLASLTMTSSTVFAEPIDPSEIGDLTIQIDSPVYMFIGYVEKDLISIKYLCNDEYFRTDTVPYGYIYTFTDPTNSLLKEAVRKFDDVQKGDYYFTSYQLVSTNPAAGEGESSVVKLNVMLGDQITVTDEITINIVAYIEGHEYVADESGGDLVNTWREEFKQQVSALTSSARTTINSSDLLLETDERTSYCDEVNRLENSALSKLSTDVSYESMQKCVKELQSEIESVLARARFQAEKNAYVKEIEDAKQNALKSFEGKTDEDGKIAEAMAKIEQIAYETQNSIRSAETNEQFESLAAYAKQEMQQVVIDYDGDRLALLKNNTITNITGRAEMAKRDIAALPYLSETKKAEFVSLIDSELENFITQINAVTSLPADSETSENLTQDFANLEMEFAQRMDGIVNLEAVGLNAVKKAQAENLSSHAAQVSEAIQALLEESIADIKADGIILINDELISSLTAFTDDRLTALSSTLDRGLQSIIEIYEDAEIGKGLDLGNCSFDEQAAEVANGLIAEIDGILEMLENDFAEKIEEASKTSREEMIALKIEPLYRDVQDRLETLNLSNKEEYLENLEKARADAVSAVNAAQNATEINEAIETFKTNVENIRLLFEKDFAQQESLAEKERAREAVTSCDFLEDGWVDTFCERIESAAAVLREQAANAPLSDDVRTAYENFLSAIEKIIDEAQEKNSLACTEQKLAALSAAEEKVKETLAAVDAFLFITDEQRSASKKEIEGVAAQAEESLPSVASKAELIAWTEDFESSLSEEVKSAQTLNETAESELKSGAEAGAKADAADCKEKIKKLPHLSEEERLKYEKEIDARLETALADIRAAVNPEAIAAAQASLAQALQSAYAAAVESDNATAGNLLSEAIVEAIKSVGEELSLLRAESEAHTFLSAEEKNSLSERFTALLSAATLNIRAAQSVEEVETLRDEYLDNAELIAQEGRAQNVSARNSAVSAAKQELEEQAELAKKEVGALVHLNGRQQVYISDLETILREADEKIQSAQTPSEIGETVKDAKAQIQEKLNAARAEDDLLKAKVEGLAALDEKDSAAQRAIEEIQALGFLSAENKRTSIEAVQTAAQAARAAIESAATSASIEQALSIYAAAVATAKDDAVLKDGESASAQRAEARAEVAAAEKALSEKIASLRYLSQERKDALNIQITTYVQTADEAIANAVNTAQLQTAISKFKETLNALEQEITDEDSETGRAKAQAALLSAENAGNAALAALSAHGFLTEQDISSYTQRIQSAVEGAKNAIEASESAEEIEAALLELNDSLTTIKADAEAQNAERTKLKKDAATADFEQRAEKEKNGLDGLSLTEEEIEEFVQEIQSAFAHGKTGVLDAQNEDMIDAALAALEETLGAVRARAELTSAKHNAEQILAGKAQEATESVNKLESLAEKDSYLAKIESALAAAVQAIESARYEAEVQAAVEMFESEISSILQGAEADNADGELAAAKQQAQESIRSAHSDADEQFNGLKYFGFLDESARANYKAELAAHAEEAELAVFKASSIDEVKSCLTALAAALGDIVGEAAEEATNNRNAVTASANSEIAEQYDRANAAVWNFLDTQKTEEYKAAVGTASDEAMAAVLNAGSAEEIQTALSNFAAAIERAQSAAAEANESARSAARERASETVVGAARDIKSLIAALGYISYADYEARIDEALNTVNEEILDADTQDGITAAVDSFKQIAEAIKAEAVVENDAASKTAVGAAQQTVDEKRSKAIERLNGLKFIGSERNTVGELIAQAVQKANEALNAAQSQMAIDEAVFELINNLDRILISAAAQNDAAKAVLVQAASQAAEEEKLSAEEIIRALRFLSEDERANALNAIAVAAEVNFSEASDPDAVEALKQVAANAVQAALNEAVAKDGQAKSEAVETAKRRAEESADGAKREIEKLGFIADGQYGTESAVQKAYGSIEEASDLTAIEDALAALSGDLEELAKSATAANEAAKAQAISEAEEYVSALDEAWQDRLNALKFLAKDSYLTDAARQIEGTTSQFAAAQDQAAIDELLNALSSALGSLASDAESMEQVAKSAVVNTAIRELQAASAYACNAVNGYLFLSEETKAAYCEQIETISAANFDDAADPAALETIKNAVLAEIENISASAEGANAANLESARAEAAAQAENAAANARNELTALDLPAGNAADFNENLEAAVSAAMSAIENGETPDDFQLALEALENGLADIVASAKQLAEELQPLQVVVEGVEAVKKTYDGTNTVEFNTQNVIYRNAETGEIIEEKYAQGFVLTVYGYLSEYGAGEQTALIVSMTLTGANVDGVEFVLAADGQQTFAAAVVEKARLTVSVTQDGKVLYEGFVGGEDESVLDGEVRLEYENLHDGTVAVKPTGLESANYEIVYVGYSLPAEKNLSVLWICLGIAAALAVCAVAVIFIKKRLK